jgi:beta-galactosidase
MQELGGNAWRTAHNAPNEGLLYAADKLGMLVWDENHRNGQTDQATTLVKRDRNHPSIIIWSICNEALCNSDTDYNVIMSDAQDIKAIFKKFDPLGQRVVSANYNGWSQTDRDVPGADLLDLLGFDYATDSYDEWHAADKTHPSISSETSSAVSDRGEYANDEEVSERSERALRKTRNIYEHYYTKRNETKL